MTDKDVVYANTPLNPGNKDHARLIAWRDREGAKSKSDTFRKMATGGGILMDAGLLDLVISLEKMPGVDAKKALLMALASTENVDFSAADMLEKSEPEVKKEMDKKPEVKRPAIGKLR